MSSVAGDIDTEATDASREGLTDILNTLRYNRFYEKASFATVNSTIECIEEFESCKAVYTYIH